MRSMMDTFLRNTPADGVAFVPMIEPLAARVGGLTYQSMTNDPAQWSSALKKAGQLLKADALVLGFDDILLAEACGAKTKWQDDRPAIAAVETLPAASEVIRGRLKTNVEALSRLCQISHKDFCCIAAMTGPVTLAKQLDITADRTGDLKQLTVTVAKALCDKRPDLLMFREGPAICTNEIGMRQRKAFNTLCNVAKYFNTPTAVYLQGYTREILSSIDKLKVDFYFFAESADGAIPDPVWFLDLAQRVNGRGVALPFSDATQALRHAELCRKTLADTNLLFTSPGELAYETDLDTVRLITTELQSLC